MLGKMLENELGKRKLSVRSAADQIGVSHTTLFRIMDGGTFDVDTLVKICDWLGVRPAEALGSEVLKGDGQLLHALALVLEKEPRLAELFRNATQEVINGTMTVDQLTDILSYATYKLGLRGDKNGHKGAGVSEGGGS